MANHINRILRASHRLMLSLMMVTLTIGVATASSPVTELPVTTINGKQYYYRTIEKKETLYSVSRQLGLTQKQVIDYNPSAYEGLKAGECLYFPVEDFGGNPAVKSDATKASQSVTVHGTTTHEVVKGETIYGISKRYGITSEQLMNANPAIRSGLKTGMTLIIPTADDPIYATTAGGESLPADTDDNTVADDNHHNALSIDIAVILSFDLDSETHDRDAANALEFYKGFLLAVDTLREFDRPIHITTYDAGSSAATLKSILAKPELTKAQVIIPPADIDGGLELVGEFGRKHNVMVFNLFNTRDKSYLTNPMMMQATVPQDVMYDKAVEGFMDKYKRYTPVLLVKDDSKPERNHFMIDLKARLTDENKYFITIPYDDELTDEAMSILAESGKYVFVPTQGSQRDLNRVLDTIIRFKEEKSCDCTIFGYPEWITYRGETLDDLHKLEATYYSRFVNDDEDRYTTRVMQAYHDKYGTAISPSVPRPGLMGFDSGIFLLRSLKASKGDLTAKIPPYQGVQNGFKFVRASDDDNAGWYNERLMFVTYRESGNVDYKDL